MMYAHPFSPRQLFSFAFLSSFNPNYSLVIIISLILKDKNENLFFFLDFFYINDLGFLFYILYLLIIFSFIIFILKN